MTVIEAPTTPEYGNFDIIFNHLSLPRLYATQHTPCAVLLLGAEAYRMLIAHAPCMTYPYTTRRSRPEVIIRKEDLPSMTLDEAQAVLGSELPRSDPKHKAARMVCLYHSQELDRQVAAMGSPDLDDPPEPEELKTCKDLDSSQFAVHPKPASLT